MTVSWTVENALRPKKKKTVQSTHCPRCERKDEAYSTLEFSENDEIRQDRPICKTQKAKNGHQRDNCTDAKPASSDKSGNGMSSRMKPIHSVNTFFTDARHSRTYRLVNRDQAYSDTTAHRVSKMPKIWKFKRNGLVFDATDPITVLYFLKTLNTACHSNGVLEGAVLSLIYYFMRKPLSAALLFRLQLRSARCSKLKKMNRSIFANAEMVNYMLWSWRNDEVVAETVPISISLLSGRPPQ